MYSQRPATLDDAYAPKFIHAAQTIDEIHGTPAPLLRALPSNPGYTLNNRYAGFPPLMADGRSVIAGWDNRSLLDAIGGQGKSAWDYHNALLRGESRAYADHQQRIMNDVGYSVRFSDVIDASIGGPLMPYSSVLDAPAGFAARPHNDSDLRDNYLNRVSVDARMMAPAMQF